MGKLITIAELSKKLNLIDVSTGKPQNHILRYWEKEFKQVKPKKINNRRYYSLEQVELLKMIKFLLKNKGMTIAGVKKTLNFNGNKLDYDGAPSLKAEYQKIRLKEKSRKILDKIKNLKNYGKKNSS